MLLCADNQCVFCLFFFFSVGSGEGITSADEYSFPKKTVTEMLLCAIWFMLNVVRRSKCWSSRHFHQLCGQYSRTLRSLKEKCDFFIHMCTIPYRLAGAT